MTYETAPAAPTNPLGRVAFILGLVIVVLGVVFSVLQAMLIATRNLELIGFLSSANALIVALLAVATVIIGIVALTRPGLPRGFAAAGTALGASALVSVILGTLTALLIPLFGG